MSKILVYNNLSHDNSRPRATRSTMEYPTERDSIVACNRKRPCRGCVIITGVTILPLLLYAHFMLATVPFVSLFPPTRSRCCERIVTIFETFSETKKKLIRTRILASLLGIADQSRTTTFLDGYSDACFPPSFPSPRLLFAQRVSSRRAQAGLNTHTTLLLLREPGSR